MDKFLSVIDHLQLLLKDPLLLETVNNGKIFVIAYTFILKQLLILLRRASKCVQFFLESILNFSQHLLLTIQVVHIKDVFRVLIVVPKQAAIVCQQFATEDSSFDLESSVFFKGDLFLNCSLQGWAFVDIIFDADSNEHMIVFVVLQGYSVPDQKQSVWESPVAEVDLRPLLKLILGSTNHQKLIEFVFLPLSFEVVAIWINFFFLLIFGLNFPLFSLFQTVAVLIRPQFVKKFLYKFQVAHIGGVNLCQSLHSKLFVATHCILHFSVDLLEIRQTHFVVEVYKGNQVGVKCSVFRSDAFSTLDLKIRKLFLKKILVLTAHVRGIIRALAGVGFFLFPWSQFPWLCKIFMGIVRIIFVVGHGIVNIHALVIEQFRIGYHSCVFEVLAKAASDQMYMDPGDVFRGEDFNIKELRVFFGDAYKFPLLSEHSFPLLAYAVLHPIVFEIVQLFLGPKSDVVDISRQILQQVKPFRLFSFLVLVEQVGQDDAVFPV